MTPVSSNTESFLTGEETLMRENTQRVIKFIDDAYESIEPKNDGDLLIEEICNGLEDAEKGLRDDINPVRVIQQLYGEFREGSCLEFVGLGVLIEISREKRDSEQIKEYKQSPYYTRDLTYGVFSGMPKIVLTQDEESSITTILAFPLLAEDILPNVNITDENRTGILYGVYQEVKRRNESKE